MGCDQNYYSEPQTPWKKHFINFSGRLAESLISGYGLSDECHFEGLDLSAELSEIIEIAKRESEDSTHEIILILNEIFIKMHAHANRATEPTKKLALEMKNFLSRRITHKFSNAELCKHISKSESQMIKIFKSAYGITPYNYVLNKRIQLAKKLLLNTSLTVKEIAYKLSFTDEYYFSGLFKSKVGVSPILYRKGENHEKS